MITDIGVYVNVERIDKSFIESHFGNTEGALFKVDEGGPGADFRYLGDDPLTYRKAFELHAGRETEANAQLVEFIRQRYTLARAQLDAPGTRPQPLPMRPSADHDGPKPGPPSNDAPSDLRTGVNRANVVVMTAYAAHYRWLLAY